MPNLDVVLDFGYVIAQKRLSSARYLMKVGISVAGLFLGLGSLVGSFSYEGFTLSADSNSSPVIPFIINVFACLGLASLAIGILLEIYEHLWGEASKDNRAKSIDLRSLTAAKAPTLSKSFPSLVESSGIHDALYLEAKSGESLTKWLTRSTEALSKFAQEDLVKINDFESGHPLAMGALAHVPHCFSLGFLVANRRLVHYYCWNRDSKKTEKSRWIDCRDQRTRGQSISGQVNVIQSEHVTKTEDVTKIGLSIELSIPSSPEKFLEKIGVDVVYQIGLKNQSIGNLFSEKEQVKIVCEIRELINNNILARYKNVKELHLSITGQASFIMRLAADMNQNHLPKAIKVYHFEKQNYPWYFELSPNSDSVKFSVLINEEG
ncbi:SAVED domain-containing protein [Pectobacterium versatile]|uniref:SAVED domain-containing protein n=1 Tax=Pectobacterium versatile TaxID=2488639 RepID=UPI001F371E63|nr:SAVED domain-containing protein [Pectobacterium versatile]